MMGGRVCKEYDGRGGRVGKGYNRRGGVKEVGKDFLFDQFNFSFSF